MDSNNQRIQRLVAWNRFWLVLLVLFGLGCSIFAYGYSVLNNVNSLRLKTSSNGDLRFSSGSDGPFIITHLITYEDQWGRAAATLPEPIAFYDSGGAGITRKEIEDLNWRDAWGDPVKAPSSSKIKVLYVSAQRLTDREFDDS